MNKRQIKVFDHYHYKTIFENENIVVATRFGPQPYFIRLKKEVLDKEGLTTDERYSAVAWVQTETDQVSPCALVHINEGHVEDLFKKCNITEELILKYIEPWLKDEGFGHASYFLLKPKELEGSTDNYKPQKCDRAKEALEAKDLEKWRSLIKQCWFKKGCLDTSKEQWFAEVQNIAGLEEAEEFHSHIYQRIKFFLDDRIAPAAPTLSR